MIWRAGDANLSTLVLTIDVPARSGMWVVPGSAGAFNVVWS